MSILFFCSANTRVHLIHSKSPPGLTLLCQNSIHPQSAPWQLWQSLLFSRNKLVDLPHVSYKERTKRCFPFKHGINNSFNISNLFFFVIGISVVKIEKWVNLWPNFLLKPGALHLTFQTINQCPTTRLRNRDFIRLFFTHAKIHSRKKISNCTYFHLSVMMHDSWWWFSHAESRNVGTL